MKKLFLAALLVLSSFFTDAQTVDLNKVYNIDSVFAYPDKNDLTKFGASAVKVTAVFYESDNIGYLDVKSEDGKIDYKIKCTKAYPPFLISQNNWTVQKFDVLVTNSEKLLTLVILWNEKNIINAFSFHDDKNSMIMFTTKK